MKKRYTSTMKQREDTGKSGQRMIACFTTMELHKKGQDRDLLLSLTADKVIISIDYLYRSLLVSLFHSLSSFETLSFSSL